ncbi:MAG: hypothetical protein GY807_15985 [Gammaproteobacteria bacterium]|nr:hypothetical protein [Gammaproteobacteria bacterium]
MNFITLSSFLDKIRSTLTRTPAPLNSNEKLLDTTERGETVEKIERPWIGVDLDGTLATFHGWRGFDHIGKPVPVMIARVKQWLEDDYQVKIVTARANFKEGIPPIQTWLAKHRLPDLEVVSNKDFNMIELWDDRAIQVLPNSGKVILRPSIIGRPSAPLLNNEIPGKTCVLDSSDLPK